MKLCIPVASAEGLDAPLHPDFGAARHLLIVEGESLHAVDREHPELISEAIVSGIDGILCSEIHPRLLYELQHSGVQVYGCEAESAREALAQFRAGELEAAPPFDPRGEAGAHACGGHEHGDHECCGGKGHDDPDHECCGGKGHGQGGGGCGGHGHGGCGCAH
ncbi:NifB/NifX family molybdenum-iron cluster-binding protein [Uliginosibacterium paludis]|uniref:NifB/NifX family molybdenum-iron cluster-binding protein n=1 Tax=Uliginosibacterium paludis TaxID=1615952 RepID=A0ABV2CSF8_9RHOO